MTQIIRIDIRTKWGEPVSVSGLGGVIDIVTGPGDALAFLAGRWHHNKGPEFKAARQSCRDALRGTVSPGVARELFVAACVEAKTLL